VTANDLPPLPGPRRKPGDWHRSIPRWALDYHYNRGSLAVLNRLPNFQRVYDLPERVLPDACLSRSLTKDEAQLELLRCAARAMGVATMRDLTDYFRMSPKESTLLLARLVDEGAISPVEVDGWNEPAYLYASAKLPREIRGASLLSPFDPVVWYRPRAERLFGFHYRIEIYVPAAQRKWGYYVLPFRVGDSIVARVDLKADRKAKKLLVMAAHEEEGIDRSHCVEQLVIELHALKDWLELDDVRVTRHNALTKELAAAV
ncbi:MAG: YcaQ family DNA glycosylase, partial [Proteobacteria bacterium]|nr:YcaQ family DNA glycosylase [Pseudomonadota bacterium]